MIQQRGKALQSTGLYQRRFATEVHCFPKLNASPPPAVALSQLLPLRITISLSTMSTSDSYIIQDAPPESSNDTDDVDSLPSSIASSDLSSEEESDAQKEWEASLQQLELMLTMVVVPYVGKYFGRKFAYWSE